MQPEKQLKTSTGDMTSKPKPRVKMFLNTQSAQSFLLLAVYYLS